MDFISDMFGDSQSLLISLALRCAAAILVLLAGRWLARRTRNWIRPLIAKSNLTISLKELVDKGLYYGILGFAALIALSVLGVPTASLITIIGVAVVILGIALQESIGNFAATVMFLLFEPFEVGDLVETCGITGAVQEIQLFNTVFLRPDQTVAVLPNGRIQSEGLINYSKEPELRLDLTIGISYSDDIAEAKEVARKIVQAYPLVLVEPEPQIVVLALGDSSVNLGVRPYVKGEDYWTALWDLTEQLKTGFDAAGLSIPFPQHDVHIIPDTAAT